MGFFSNDKDKKITIPEGEPSKDWSKDQLLLYTTNQDVEISSLSSNLENSRTAKDILQKDNETLEKKLNSVQETLDYASKTKIPALKKEHKEEIQTYETKVKEILENQDISVVAKKLSKSADEFYKGVLASFISGHKDSVRDFKYAPENYNDNDVVHSFLNFGNLYAAIADLGVRILVDTYEFKQNGSISTSVPDSEKGSPHDFFAKSKMSSGFEFLNSPNNEFLRNRAREGINFRTYPGQRNFNDIYSEDVVINLKNETKDPNVCENVVKVFYVTGNENNAFVYMVQKDLPLILTTAAVGAFEKALSKNQFDLARRIHNNYFDNASEPINEVVTPMLVEALERNPQGLGYFSNLKQ